MIKRLIFGVFFLLFLLACALTDQLPVADAEPTALLPTRTPLPTFTPTAEAQVVVSVLPTPTATLPPPPTNTPVPP
ncbi:MAG: hypothetical protein D6768_19715, partial [Chloroflexi bacterium]